MTREEMKTIMKYFQSAYKGFYEGANITDVMNVWYDALKEEDVKVVQTASRNYVQSNEFAPTVAGLMKQINLIKGADTNTDLWDRLRKAISNSTYNSAEEFEKLPKECKSFVGSPMGLRNLAMEDMGTIDTVVKGQFLKNVDSIKERQNVQDSLPMEVKQALTANVKQLEEKIGGLFNEC